LFVYLPVCKTEPKGESRRVLTPHPYIMGAMERCVSFVYSNILVHDDTEV
tara:strand:- start:99 stop:248 length:150 start_codon:yes stop_codon:yes gene_type:complete